MIIMIFVTSFKFIRHTHDVRREVAVATAAATQVETVKKNTQEHTRARSRTST